ncbi:hypothetical protein VB779_13995 [Haloarculaceae archaeon H-GB11]|nr:hypothetical protein [Haloarculaceae archaeon H-GB11]
MADEQPIFDYTSSAPWEQVIRSYGSSDDLDRTVEDMMANGTPGGETWEAIWDHEVRRFESDAEFRDAVRDVYETAGVNLLSVTPGHTTTSPSAPDSAAISRAGRRGSTPPTGCIR